MERFSVDIVSYSDDKDKFDNYTYECKNINEVSRVLLTHKFKKSFYMVNVNITRVEILI